MKHISTLQYATRVLRGQPITDAEGKEVPRDGLRGVKRKPIQTETRFAEGKLKAFRETQLGRPLTKRERKQLRKDVPHLLAMAAQRTEDRA